MSGQRVAETLSQTLLPLLQYCHRCTLNSTCIYIYEVKRQLCVLMSSTYRSIAPITNQRNLYPLPITALAFDPVSDILWSGNNTGNVVAYYGSLGNRGVVFPVGGGLAVKKIAAGDNYVRALGSAGAGIGSWGKGGVNKWYYRYVVRWVKQAIYFMSVISCL